MDQKSKTESILEKTLEESSYYTGEQGATAPEAMSPYEFSRDSVPSLNKMGNLGNRYLSSLPPQSLPFPLQDALRELADIYVKTQDLRNKVRDAKDLPLFKGKEEQIEDFRNKLNGIMVECKKLASNLQDFSLAPFVKNS
jgi:hypothetical protein